MNKREKHKLFGMFNAKEEETKDQKEEKIMPTEEDSVSKLDEEVVDTDMEDTQDDEELEGQLALDMYQTKDNLVVKSTIAGVRPEDIDVTVNDNVLTISGERTQQDEVREKDYYLQECYWGEFSRSVELPEEFDAEGISAEIKDGILTVVIPKSEKAKPKKIMVKG